MATPIFVCGAECGIVSAGAASPGTAHWTAVTGTAPTASTTTFKSGLRAYSFSPAAAASNFSKTISSTRVVGSVQINFSVLPAANTILIQLTNANGNLVIQYNATTLNLEAKVGTGTAQAYTTAPSIKNSTATASRWMRIDFDANCVGGTATLDWKVENQTQTQATNSQTSASMTAFLLGIVTATTGTMFADDIVLSYTGGDYPLNVGSVIGLSPNASGAHSFTTGDFQDNTSTNIATNDTTVAHTFVDDVPITGIADFIKQVVIRSTGYIRVGFQDTTVTNINAMGVELVSSHHAAGTLANTSTLTLDDGGTLSDSFTLGTSNTTTVSFATKQYATPPSGGTWTSTKVNALAARWGYSTDVTDNPYLDGLMLEVAYPSTYTVSSDLILIADGDTTSSQGTWTRVAGTSSANPTVDPDGKVEGVAAMASKLGATVTPTDVGVSLLLTTAFNSTGYHLFHWRNITTPANMNNKSAAGVFIHLSSDASVAADKTNYKQWYIEGGNTDILGGWKCYVIDPASTADLSAGTLSLTAIKVMEFDCRQATGVTTTLFNHYVDVVRQGTGLTVIDGVGQTPGTFANVLTWDSNQLRAWGIITQSGGVYFGAAKLNFGTSSQISETVFKDTSQTLIWRDFNVASGFNEIVVVGASTQKTTFQLGTYTPASGLVSAGCTIKGSGNTSGTARLDGVAGPAHGIWKLTASNANQVTKLYGCTFSEMLSAALAYNAVSIDVTNCTTNATTTVTSTSDFNASGIVVGMLVTGTGISSSPATYVSSVDSSGQITLNRAATASGTVTLTFAHNNEIRGCSFANSGAITTNGCVIDSCTIQDVKTGAPISATYAMIIASSTEGNRVTNTKFINCNRAIKITAAGTYTFDNLTFSGNTYDIENSSAGLVTVNLTNGSNASTHIETGGGTTNIVLSVTVSLTVVNESGTAVQGVQVYFQKSATGKTWNYTSDTGNNAGDADFVVNEALDTDLPQTGWVHVWNASTNTKQNYRYASWTSKTFTFPTEVTGSATSTGSSTSLISTSTNFTTADIQEGDTIRNTTTGAWAVVDEIVDSSHITTSALSSGIWTSGDAFSFHKLAITYTDNNDLVDIPIFNGQTNASGVISTTYNYSAYGVSLPVMIRVRSNEGATKYVPYTTSGTITSSGFSGTVVITQDTVAT